MINGWISLRVADPKSVGEWYHKVVGLEIVGGREDIGSVALGTSEHGEAMILLPGPSLEHPDRLQMHFHVANVDAEYNRLKELGVDFAEPPKDMPWGWRHAYTHDPVGHTVELVTPLPNAKFKK